MNRSKLEDLDKAVNKKIEFYSYKFQKIKFYICWLYYSWP